MNGKKIKVEYKKGIKLRASGCSTVVQHLPHHPKVEGLNLATSDNIRDRKWQHRFVNLVPNNFYNTVTNLVKILHT
jgi:hypothetical protein